jgi:hypothetical protein
MRNVIIVSLLCMADPATALAEALSTPAEPSIASAAAAPSAAGWYIAPTVSFTSINQTYGEMVGLRSALMLNRQVGVGVAGNLMGTSRAQLRGDAARDVGIYGGLYLQYLVAAGSVLHAYADTTLGAGSWCAESKGEACRGREFAVLEPTFNVELTLSPNVRLATGLGYRVAVAGAGPGISSRHLSGVVARTSLVLGMF